MRLILTLILALPLFAQLDIPLMSKRPGLSRSALAAGVQTGSGNLVRNSEAINLWSADPGVTVDQNIEGTADRVNLPANVNYGVYQTMVIGETGQYAYTAEMKLASGSAAVRLGQGVSVKVTVTDQWVEYTTIETLTAGSVFMGIRNDAASALSVLVRNVRFNKGSTALPYVATTGLQSIASLPPGTATLVRGANTGASTDDPTVSLAGWTFDFGDRVSGLPATGAARTTTNCSGVECYTITSAGTEYINGVARRNLLRWSGGPFNASPWLNIASSPGTNTLTFTATSGSRIYQDVSVAAGTYVFSAELSVDSGTYEVRILSGGGATTATVTTTPQWFSVTATNPTNVVITNNVAATTGTINVHKTKLSFGSTALPYQKTTDSREWLLETPGNYVGLLTWWGRWDRVLNPGEVLNNYRAWLKPRINSVGNTLP